jgi:FkbM family methyltransferase
MGRLELNTLTKRVISYVPGLFGYEIRRKQPEAVESIIVRSRLTTILDIGANVGQFALGMRLAFPDAIIHSFEPIPSIEEKLREVFTGDRRFFSYQTAVSDREGSAHFEVNQSSASSSLLSLGEAHEKAYPELTVVKEIEVPIITLDRWAEGKNLVRPMLLKLDVQGNELAALRGARSVLEQVSYVLTEVNFASMYKGQPSFDELYQLLRSAGFHFVDLFPSKRDDESLRCLFGDALFAK